MLLNASDVDRFGIRPHDRVGLSYGDKVAGACVDVTKSYIRSGQIGVMGDMVHELGLRDGAKVSVRFMETPASVKLIHRKMKGEALGKEDIVTIVRDVVRGNLEDVEIAAYLLAEQYVGMTMREIEHLTHAMVDTGEKVQFDRGVYDKHSIGGVPGNKITLLIVPIVAASGLLIPKTSSKAITSPSGTADTMSVLAPVEFSGSELKKIASKVGGAIVWGGGLKLAPADDLFIAVEYALQIDPVGQMLASIMSKKLAVGTSNLVIDLPTGKGAKIQELSEARDLAHKFTELGERLKMQVRCAVTYGGQPVGHSVGPALEAREALMALMGKDSTSLVEKATAIAGLLIELSGKVPKGRGQDYAREVLSGGKALKKMREIIEAQGGEASIQPDDIPVGTLKAEIKAPCDGWITSVSNETINSIARAAGAPRDKGAGLVISGKIGRKVTRDQVIMEIYAERDTRLDEALSIATQSKPITVEGMLLHEFPEY